MRRFYSSSIDDCLKILNSKKEGLSFEEARTRLSKFSCLNIITDKKRNIFLNFLAQFSDLMVLILLLSSFVSIIVGLVQKTSEEIVDGVIILGIVIVNAIIGVIQENKAERSMEALKKMSLPESLIIRSGVAIKELTNNIVPGDIVVLEAGAIVPADCRLIESFNLYANESSLTGESLPVHKNANKELNEDCPLSERKNMVYKGTTIATGRGLGVVTAIGIETELGKIAKSVRETKKELTPLQKGIKDIGKILTFLILLMATVTFVLEILARSKPMESFLTAVAISVAAIPESMPAVITIIMSLGIARLAKQRAIITRMHSVETLGCCDVICSDKTGTITQNKMTVMKVFEGNKFVDKMPSSHLILSILLCNDAVKGDKGYVGDPTEIALVEYALKFDIKKEEMEKKFPRIDEISFDSNRKLMSTLNSYQGQTMFVKGAFDILLEKCDRIFLNGKVEILTQDKKEELLKANEFMSMQALRVLGVAYKTNINQIAEENLIFIGLIGMIDPPKPETYNAVLECKKAGMRPVMITGDHYNTAFAIAKQVGIAEDINQVITGKELDNLSDEELLRKIDHISVFARVSPENKARIVSILKEKGHIVAMTGDGVNDAPSLKKASIGIGMGISGTDVVKEVADMVITDDNFSTIVVAVKEGRKVYKNIQKTVKFLFSANMGEILSLFLATIIFPRLVFLLPVQILFVNLITDSLPAIALGVENAEANLMREKPRKSEEGIFSSGHGIEIIVMGLAQTVIILLSYFIGLKFMGEKEAMTMAFYTLNMIQLFFLLCARTEGSVFKSNPFKNKLLTISLIFGFGVIFLIAMTPLGKILGLTSLSPKLWFITILLSASIILISEIYKYLVKKIRKRGL